MADARARFRELDAAKTKLEGEIAALVDALGDVGMHTPLVDAEGFPRDDIDIVSITSTRHLLACKQTDHVAVMKELESVMEQCFAAAGGGGGDAAGAGAAAGAAAAAGAGAGGHAAEAAAAAAAGDAASASESKAAPYVGPPIAVVNSVAPRSPAAAAGLRAGDEVLRFGTADAGNTASLLAVATIVRGSVGVGIPLLVRRGGDAQLELELVPGSWPGPGLLGVHLVPPPTPDAS